MKRIVWCTAGLIALMMAVAPMRDDGRSFAQQHAVIPFGRSIATSNPSNCTQGEFNFRYDLPALYGCSAADTWSNLTGGGSSTPSLDSQYRGIGQNTVASFGVSWGTDGRVTAECPTLTNTLYSGHLSFADSDLPNSCYDISKLMKWVRQRFAPQHVSYATAGHDGGRIGAVDPIAIIGGVLAQ
jgi:hypothetical protein